MKLTREQKKKIRCYRNDIYPLNLYVARSSDIDLLNEYFVYYWTVEDMQEDRPAKNNVESDESSLGMTCMVKEPNGSKGILIILEDLTKESFSKQVDVISHESTHAATAISNYLGLSIPSYDRGDEHYAYLLGWIAGCVANAFITFKQEDDGTDRE